MPTKYVPARLLSTYPSHLDALLALGCPEGRAQELLQEAAMGNSREMLIDVGEEEQVAITSDGDGHSQLWEAYGVLSCKSQQQALEFINHVEERRKEPSTWMVLEVQDSVLH